VEKGEKNYYEILEISPQANQDEVYNGYIKAKNAYSAVENCRRSTLIENGP